MLKIRKLGRGFTLVEILIVMAILILLIIAATGSLNPLALVNKGKDAQRKKDLVRLRIAFEEYFADKGCYPSEDLLVDLESKGNCKTDIFSPWLPIWPCDPEGQPYFLVVENIDCPSWFKGLVNLDNRKDRDIPDGWYELGETFFVGDGTLGTDDANFGVSSTNVSWYERVYDPACFSTGQCQQSFGTVEHPACQPADPDPYFCSGDNCYFDGNCSAQCKTSCCRNGAVCQ